MKYFLRSTNFKILSQIQWDPVKESLVTQHFVVTQKTGQTEIPATPDISLTNATSDKMLCQQNNCLSLYFRTNVPCWSVSLLRIGEVLSFWCKSVYRWVSANCCCVSEMWILRFIVSVTSGHCDCWPGAPNSSYATASGHYLRTLDS
jgi:hypothetical protein